MPLDPTRVAARRDLADIRLADRVFAPHYARALPTRADRATDIHERPGGLTLAALAVGASFRVLELTDRWAWGQAGEDGVVGYVDRAALTAG